MFSSTDVHPSLHYLETAPRALERLTGVIARAGRHAVATRPCGVGIFVSTYAR